MEDEEDVDEVDDDDESEYAVYDVDGDEDVDVPVMTRGVIIQIPSLRGKDNSTRPFLVTRAISLSYTTCVPRDTS